MRIVFFFLHRMQIMVTVTPTVADSYGSVLLRGGASAYVVVGIAAFAVGVTVTMICIRLKNKSKDRTVSTEERED